MLIVREVVQVELVSKALGLFNGQRYGEFVAAQPCMHLTGGTLRVFR